MTSSKLKYIWLFIGLFWGMVIIPQVVLKFFPDYWARAFWVFIPLITGYSAYVMTQLLRLPLITFISVLLVIIYSSADLCYKVTRFFTDVELLGGYGFSILLAVISYYVLYKNRHRFDFDLIDTVEYDPSAFVLLAYRPPKRFIEYIGAILHLHPVGSYKLIIKGQEVGFDHDTGAILRKDFVPNGQWKYSCSEQNADKVLDRLSHIYYFDKQARKKGIIKYFYWSKKQYHVLFNNCYKFKRVLQ